MRILRVAQNLYPEVPGGGTYHVHAMSRDQAAMGHDVTVLTVGNGSHREHRDGYNVVRKSALVEPLGNSISPGVAAFLRNAGSFDVVHAHSHLYFSTNLAALARAFIDTPLAITNHGTYSQTAPGGLFRFYLHTLGRWTFNQADVVFTYTEPEQQELQSLGVATDIEVITNGIDIDRFTPEGNENDRIDTQAAVILFVGRLVAGKRPVDAVKILRNLRERGNDATLYVVGTGPLEPKMRSLAAEYGFSESIVFLGHVPYDEMPSLFRAADVLVLTSRNEGLPRSVLEAMATGTPVVASALPQLDGLIETDERKVPIGDVDSFAEALESVLELAEQDGHEASPEREKILSEFEWSDTVKRTTAVLRDIQSR